MEQEKIILEIEKMIDWYQKNYSKGTILQLMDLKSKLVTYLYNLGDILSHWKKDYTFKYYIRKIAVSRKKNTLIKNGEAISKAESIATEEEADRFQDEIESESFAYSIENKLKQANFIVNDITQRIAVLRNEKENN